MNQLQESKSIHAKQMELSSRMNQSTGYLQAVNDLYDLLVFKGVESELKSEIWSTMMQKALQYPPKEEEILNEKL